MLRYFLPFTGYPYRGEATDCPVCGSSDHAPIARFDRKWKRLPTELCRGCGLFFTNPMPTDAELAAYYANTYRLEYQVARARPHRDHTAKKQREAERRRARLTAVGALPEGAVTLDFGCGSGELVHLLAREGWHAHGFEPGASYAAYAREAAETGAEIAIGAWSEMDYPPAMFDAITCLHVLEHLNRPLPALRRMREWLKPGGVLYLEVPDMQAYEPKGALRFHFAHVLGFSGDNLLLAARAAGLRPMRIDRATSVFLVHADDPRAMAVEIDPEATAARNARDYGAGLGPGRYLGYHARRARRLIGRHLSRR